MIMVKRKGRKRQKLLCGKVEESVELSTTGAGTVVSEPFDETVNERTFALSIDAVYSLRNLTAGQGPILIGIAHSDYTSAEIEEWIENTGSWNEGNLTEQEISKRKIRQIGIFDGEVADEVMNDGVAIKIPLKFILNQGQGLRLWVYNKSGAAFTDGAYVYADGKCWLKPT